MDNTITFEWNNTPSVNDQMNLAYTFNMLTQIQIADGEGKIVPLLKVYTAFKGIGEPIDDYDINEEREQGQELVIKLEAVPETPDIEPFGYYFNTVGMCYAYYGGDGEPWEAGIRAVLKHIKARVSVDHDQTRINAILKAIDTRMSDQDNDN
ncbi:MAG: hypothetical protein CEO22_152 [Candidatus Berkelbacteria bacterium Gr01-1014_85]|uniref:Uncharacterized protein n=1 Tax=Candidatus Berkelbacteria bacterium Gr01-1014_85 TaxID=2017150 RepID=A0A554JD86_9BACT|nr:MAG: hypothetical protein CEO22_152 [Candidatus Berkelbacteria bacterium Gr01-1014_85]